MICNRKRNVTPRGVEVTDAQFRAGPLPAEARQIWQWLVQSGRVFSEREQGEKMDDEFDTWLHALLRSVWARETSADDALAEILDRLDDELDEICSLYERGDWP